jgi:hypothetical protein
MSEIPRRNQLQLLSLGEMAIRQAQITVEEMGCDVLLTQALVLLGEARDKVADYVDRESK